MLRRVLAVLCAVPLLAQVAIFAPPAAAATDPAVFFSAHQDDDTLTFGPDVAAHVAAGREVIVVLATDGSESGVCKTRYTGSDGTYSATDRADCTALRDSEFKRAVTDLGATPAIAENRVRDGQLTEQAAAAIIQPWVDKYPGGSFKTHTYKESNYPDGHSDHDALGEAMRDLVTGTTDKRYYIKPELWGSEADGCQEYECRFGFTSREDIDRALDDYFAFGHFSVAGSFAEQYSDDTDLGRFDLVTAGGAQSKVHLPGE